MVFVELEVKVMEVVVVVLPSVLTFAAAFVAGVFACASEFVVMLHVVAASGPLVVLSLDPFWWLLE
eukprot:2025587-Ditylum_brightwellii.AAC.1